MITINESYLKLQASYLFAELKNHTAAFQEAHPERDVIKLGIGDVTRPLPPACIQAFHRGVDEMADAKTFRGYGPEQGYGFLREKIAHHDFQTRGADIAPDEIFISDGAKCDNGNIQEIFSKDIKIAIPDPVYPVYVEPFEYGRAQTVVQSGCEWNLPARQYVQTRGRAGCGRQWACGCRYAV